jgi:hypothetical protein
MRRAAIVLVGWGGWLGALTALQAAFRSIRGPFGVHWIEAVMLGAASGACLLSGTVLWALDARRDEAERPRFLTADSFATAALATGLSLALLGAGFGLWLILIGAAVSALGAGGLVRELLAMREAGRRREGAR